jgi:hypothetical protein
MAPPERFHVKLPQISTIEQFDAIGAVRQFFMRRRRGRVVTEIRDHADAVFFADLAEQHRLDQRRKRADAMFAAVFGAHAATLAPWQRQLAYDTLKALEEGKTIVIGVPF